MGTIAAPSLSKYDELAGHVPAGFWQRLIAFVIDVLIVSVPCFALAEVFHDFFLASPALAKIVGFIVTVLYFAVFGSRVVDGQTLGMMALRLKLVSRDGLPLSISRSLARYSTLFIPFLLTNILPLHTPGVIANSYETLMDTAGLVVLYLAIFNRKTGQSLHDLVTDTFVVDSPGAGPVRVEKFWKPHWAYICGLVVLGYGVMEISPRTSSTFAELTTIQSSIQRRTNLEPVNVTRKFSGGHSGIVIAAACDQISTDHNKAAGILAGAALESDAQVQTEDYLAITCTQTLSLGFFKSTTQDSVVHTPEEWKNIIQHDSDLTQSIPSPR